jgi:hypothetical protein
MRNNVDESGHYPGCVSGHAGLFKGYPKDPDSDNELVCSECGAVIPIAPPCAAAQLAEGVVQVDLNHPKAFDTLFDLLGE